MRRWKPFEEHDDAWRRMLPRWSVQEAPASIESALRSEFRRRRRSVRMMRWGVWAAAVVLITSGSLTLVRRDDARRVKHHTSDGFDGVRVSITDNQVMTELDLTGFQPLPRPRLTRMLEAATETSLEGYVPVRTPRLTRCGESEGGRR